MNTLDKPLDEMSGLEFLMMTHSPGNAMAIYSYMKYGVIPDDGLEEDGLETETGTESGFDG